MMIGHPPEKKYHRFETYLRVCYRCDNFFDADTQKTHYCAKCKALIKEEKIVNSLKARGIERKVKQEITNECNKDN
jgi:hypothetical protein